MLKNISETDIYCWLIKYVFKGRYCAWCLYLQHSAPFTSHIGVLKNYFGLSSIKLYAQNIWSAVFLPETPSG